MKLDARRLRRLDSWGGAISTLSYVYRPESVEALAEALEAARRTGVPLSLRGAGCSYGDAPLNRERIAVDVSALDRILDWDPATGIARVEPGVTIRQLWRHALSFGYWPAVVPGTMFPTVGGCAAMNIHGKNNFAVGPIGEHVVGFDLLLPSGEIRRCSAEHDGELFHAAIGGFGMLGAFTSITLRLKKVHSGLLEVEPVPAANLQAMVDAFEERRRDADYLVGWIDCYAGGAQAGRGQIHAARHLAAGEDPRSSHTLRVETQDLPARFMGFVPMDQMWRIMRLLSYAWRPVNAGKYYSAWLPSASKRYTQPLAAFSFLLDYFPNWKRAVGAGGLIQYQSFVPARRAVDTFRAQLDLCRHRGLVPYLGVFKRHRPDDFLMTHAVDGYSLALDFRVTEANRSRLWSLTAELDALVLDAGGRFYFAKDQTLSERAKAALRGEPRARKFLDIKKRLDPAGLFQTDLFRRVFGVE